MDLNKYDKLRKKIEGKDFEGRNNGLDKWLYRISFIGNVGSIFFATFLIYPALLKTITLNFIGGFFGTALALSLTIIFLGIFELIKRYLIKNFSNEYYQNKKHINFQIFSWLGLSILIITLSFYLSISGSKNLATTSNSKDIVIETTTLNEIDSLQIIYDKKTGVYEKDNEELRTINNNIRKLLSETPINYRIVRKEYQANIDKNINEIEKNNNKISQLNNEFNQKKSELEEKSKNKKTENKSEDNKIIFLYFTLVIVNEWLIVGGIYFREYYEYKLYLLNHQKYEKVYERKDRYKALLTFIYNHGKLKSGDKVLSSVKLKEIIANKTTIPNSNKLIDGFLHDMERLNIFTVNGKRRYVAVSYDEAIEILNHYDDIYQIIENMK